MNQKEKKFVEELEKLEPVFRAAGMHALSRQKDIRHTKKMDSGYFEVDVVSEADPETQEIILQAMAKTCLTECHLIAEEDTPTVKKFKKEGNLYLTIDPIDGTALYVEGKKIWSVLICFHNQKEMLYTFAYFPAVNWINKIVGEKYECIGKLPEIETKLPPEGVIVHSYGSTDLIDRETFNALTKQGYKFKVRQEFSDESGGSSLFLTNDFAGYYIPNPNAYDGLVMYHYAKAMGYKIISKGPDGEDFRIDRLYYRHGLAHPGYYIVLRNKWNKRHFANIVLVNEKDQVLVQLRDVKPGVTFQGLWALPGGRIDEGESGEEAVVRECKEETAYQLKSPNFLKKIIYPFVEENHHPDVEIFYSEYDGKQKIVCNEGQRMEFVPLSDLNEQNSFPMHKQFAEEVIKRLKEKNGNNL